jgi:selenocysteine lyase/cysteine desulfurase
MHLNNLKDMKSKYKVFASNEKPIVFMSIFEHNSNNLPWREAGARMEVIGLTEDGGFDYDGLVR